MSQLLSYFVKMPKMWIKTFWVAISEKLLIFVRSYVIWKLLIITHEVQITLFKLSDGQLFMSHKCSLTHQDPFVCLKCRREELFRCHPIYQSRTFTKTKIISKCRQLKYKLFLIQYKYAINFYKSMCTKVHCSHAFIEKNTCSKIN